MTGASSYSLITRAKRLRIRYPDHTGIMAGNNSRLWSVIVQQHPIDWPATFAEALDIFVRYLQIPSVNPPGNEAPAARYLGSLIEAEGIPVEYIETAPNREIVYARLYAA